MVIVTSSTYSNNNVLLCLFLIYNKRKFSSPDGELFNYLWVCPLFPFKTTFSTLFLHFFQQNIGKLQSLVTLGLVFISPKPMWLPWKAKLCLLAGTLMQTLHIRIFPSVFLCAHLQCMHVGIEISACRCLNLILVFWSKSPLLLNEKLVRMPYLILIVKMWFVT